MEVYYLCIIQKILHSSIRNFGCETNALYEDWARKHGLSYYELLVILSLSEKDMVHTQKNICRRWQLPKQTVNSILKNFIGRDWVVLVPSAEDKRNKVIVPTKEGKSVIHKVSSQLAQDEKNAWKALGEKACGCAAYRNHII